MAECAELELHKLKREVSKLARYKDAASRAVTDLISKNGDLRHQIRSDRAFIGRLKKSNGDLRAEVERLRELLRRCTRVMCGYRDVEEIDRSPLLDAMAELEKKEATDG